MSLKRKDELAEKVRMSLAERAASSVPARVDRGASHVDGQAHLEATRGIVIEALTKNDVAVVVVHRGELGSERRRLVEQI